MLFTEPRFALFISVVLVAYWLCRSNNVRKNILLVSSYVFYGAWDWRFAVMLGGLSTADYFFARGIISSDNSTVRKFLVVCSACMNISVLFVFKYFNFFSENAVRLANILHVNLDYPTIHLVLPVGVSFFTFQSLSYTIDVYRREMPPAKSLRDYLLFAAFFPQLVAGPIVRPKIFLPQLDSVRRVGALELRLSLLLFLVGFAKKMCIADNISPYVDQVFSNPASFGNLSTIAAVWLYALQIYCDFSGYSDMAIAVAALLGYKLCVNFDAPYLATSIQDFWRRWHISLSSWIRDYIYVSLGGRSASRIRTYRNLLLTMLAGGLWHGAAWTYVAWGGAHGLGQIVHQEYRHRLQHAMIFGVGSLIGWLLTLNFVCVCWILFRAPNFAASSVIIERYFGLVGGGSANVPLWLLTLPPALLLLQFALRKFNVFLRVALLGLESYALVCGSIVSLMIAMLPFGYKPFIYFQF